MKQEKLLIYGTFIVGLIATLMIFLPALSIDDTSYTGFEIAFGKQLADIDFFGLGSVASAKLPFSILASLAYALPLIAGIVALAFKKARLVSSVFFVIALVLMFTLPNVIEVQYTLAGNESSASVDWVMSFGLILAIVTSAIGAVLSFISSLK